MPLIYCQFLLQVNSQRLLWSAHGIHSDLVHGVYCDLVHSKHCEFEAAGNGNTANHAPIHGVYCGQITVTTVTEITITVNAVN